MEEKETCWCIKEGDDHYVICPNCDQPTFMRRGCSGKCSYCGLEEGCSD
jgi:hypothetical protein